MVKNSYYFARLYHSKAKWSLKCYKRNWVLNSMKLWNSQSRWTWIVSSRSRTSAK